MSHRALVRRSLLPGVLALTLPVGVGIAAVEPANADVQQVVSSLTGTDGKTYTVTNHLTKEGQQALKPRAANAQSPRKEWLLVWAGDQNIADTTGGDLKNLPISVDLPGLIEDVSDALPGPDFLAVIDVTKGSPDYGKVVNTATVGPLVENEPHHMQYVWHKGDKIFAGALFLDTTYVFDVKNLPELKLSGINLPTDTLGGSVPDAYWTLKDGTAYGTYMGGPDLPGPYVYSDGSIRSGNGFGGSPGELVHLDQNGKTLYEAPATPATAEKSTCVGIPTLGLPTCANPHGIQAREDLDRVITSDYSEPRNIILNPVSAPSSYIRRPTVRTWDISNTKKPKLHSVSYLPDGPREARQAHWGENYAAMETTVTNSPQNKGAFVATMSGGAIFYTPDITAKQPVFKEVFDLTTANKYTAPGSTIDGATSGGGWLQTSPDDKYLFHAVIGRGAGTLGDGDTGSPGQIIVLDIQKLLASGSSPQCSIDTLDEVADGGAEADCPAIADTLPITDTTSGGPHWGALDNFELGPDGLYQETKQIRRIATSNYFVARTGLNGNHKVNLADFDPSTGQLTLDETFRDEYTGTPGVDFNRKSWPHGDFGAAKPHSELFVVADADVR